VTDLVFWNLVVRFTALLIIQRQTTLAQLLRTLIYPVKLCVVAWHELGHTIGCVMSGHRIVSVAIDPNEGGRTMPVSPLTEFIERGR
jgi:hypothetical protein